MTSTPASTPAGRYWAVVPAAGTGSRFGGDAPKQYATIGGRTVIESSLAPLLEHPEISGIVLVLARGDERGSALAAGLAPKVTKATGGALRAESVRNGLLSLSERAREHDWVLVHDAARPCLPRADLDRLLVEVGDDPVGGILAAPLGDTVKQGAASGRIERTVERFGLWRALTPQMFRYGLLCRALDSALAAGMDVTDDAAAMERAGHQPRLIAGSAANIKVTRPEDLSIAAALMAAGDAPAVRIGHGYDVHAFQAGDHVTLGGVRIAHDRGVLAHSDGDVVIHALCDALLGAAGLGDIGEMFPPSDPALRGADSRAFLRQVATELRGLGFAIGNVDISVIAEVPRILEHKPAMRANLAADLGIVAGRVNIKATSMEGLGAIGRREGFAAHAVAVLTRARTAA
ncbi:MAG TPA: 2-C-methyl-D-erythritol 4-phosphate cytidylyltransferase [Steroidobacteraceae bacterium]|nr:2-C-methyl-D-erythritol 4-phosphate cytidylyltransferase [Steroidobacteraceae bacterium]